MKEEGNQKTNQGGDPSARHEPSTLFVGKNYFFFFAAGFLATAFFAGFFFAATVLTSHRGLKACVMSAAHHRWR